MTQQPSNEPTNPHASYRRPPPFLLVPRLLLSRQLNEPINQSCVQIYSARLPAARDSLYSAAERRLAAATTSPGYSGGRGGRGSGSGNDCERRRGTTTSVAAAAAARRCSMASSSRVAAARPGVAARSGAAKAVALAARKRGSRDRKPTLPFKNQGNGKGRASPPVDSSSSSSSRCEEPAVVTTTVGKGGAQRSNDQQQVKAEVKAKVKGDPAAAGAAASQAATKGFHRRKINHNGKKKSSPLYPKPPPSASVDPLGVYFKTLKKIKLLKADEEVVLGRRIQRGESCM